MRATRRVGETFGLRAMAPFGLRARALRATVSGTFWLKTCKECFLTCQVCSVALATLQCPGCASQAPVNDGLGNI